LNQLKIKDNYIAVVLKDTHSLVKSIKLLSNEKVLVQCVLDEDKNKIINARILKCVNISNDIVEMFGDNDMIILN
jgi:hypothetical protein